MSIEQNIGVIGGTGQLGWAIAQGLLSSELIASKQLWISNRSGKSPASNEWSGINFTTSNQDLVDACQIVILSVPPHLLSSLQINAKDCLIVSVMAGFTIEMIQQHTGANRIVRAMSSPAAAQQLAYSPWCVNTQVTDKDRETVTKVFNAVGLTDQVPDEDQIDRFTVLTGPVPGFIAFFADCMVKYAVNNGISTEIANRAIRQLFLSGGTLMANSTMSPGEHVKEMIDYAGTTAAGLQAMENSPITEDIGHGLDKAYEKTKTIA